MEPTAHVTVELPVQWGDMDALGHVNNTRFFTWFESARIALFDKIGVASAGPSAVAPILATTTCNYLTPLHFPAQLRVSARCTKVGETSLTMEYEVACGDRVLPSALWSKRSFFRGDFLEPFEFSPLSLHLTGCRGHRPCALRS